MTLIKLGEIVDKPQHKRVHLIKRAKEEQRAAMEAKKKEDEASEAVQRERKRQAGMNDAALLAVVHVWRAVHNAASIDGMSDEVKALRRRLANRSELQLVLSEPEGVKRLPPGEKRGPVPTCAIQPMGSVVSCG